jgi:hypothetical protein
MALCNEACCNAELRKAAEAEAAALLEERRIAFEAWLADRDAKANVEAEAMDDPNDISFVDAIEALGMEVAK